ncbi:MAG: extracellular solute-binding protein [Candidatus Spechtbacterales bacterium]
MSFFSDFSYNWQVMPPYKKNRIIVGIVVAMVLAVVVFGVLSGFFKQKVSESQPVTIEFWDSFDTGDDYLEVFSRFTDENPNVSVQYRKIPPELYRQTVTDALAEGEGPDVYVIHNTWLTQGIRRLAPMNEFVETNPALILNEFPDVVRFDFTREGSAAVPFIYALPISIDTLALYYNADYLNSEGIVEPPATLEQLVEYSNRLRKIDEAGNIQLAGLAVGAADNVDHATDILSLLMLQGGAQMNSTFDESVTFDQPIKVGEDIFFPARDAMNFYTSFSDPAAENYTWSPASENSLEAFIKGKVAMMINYSDAENIIRRENPALNFKVAPMPQPAGRFDKITYANYWGLAVAKNSKNAQLAWELIHYLTQPENATLYLRASGRPPALKSLIGEPMFDEEGGEILDPDYDMFSTQILTARSWIQPDPVRVDSILKNAINYVLNGEKSAALAIGDAVQQINSIINF